MAVSFFTTMLDRVTSHGQSQLQQLPNELYKLVERVRSFAMAHMLAVGGTALVLGLLMPLSFISNVLWLSGGVLIGWMAAHFQFFDPSDPTLLEKKIAALNTPIVGPFSLRFLTVAGLVVFPTLSLVAIGVLFGQHERLKGLDLNTLVRGV